jgi:hypothetical protein
MVLRDWRWFPRKAAIRWLISADFGGRPVLWINIGNTLLMHSDIDDMLTHFLAANCGSDLIDIVIDTSVAMGDGDEMVPDLNLWAFDVANTENWGFLEDAVQERDSSALEI